MIFATVGSTQIPFERFIRALETLPGEQLLVQHGPVEPPPGAARANAFMQFPEMIESMEAAEVVVCHAGAGSILCALRAGHTPVVVPRLKRYQETVDDHQVEFSRALAAERKVIAVEDLDGLSAAVKAAPGRRSAEDRSGLLPIQAAVREALHASPILSDLPRSAEGEGVAGCPRDFGHLLSGQGRPHRQRQRLRGR